MKNLLYILFISIAISCNSQEKRTLHEQNSFCYWQTTFDLGWSGPDSLRKANINHLYIRYFDVDWDFISQEAKPISTMKSRNDSIPVKVITPSIFFKNIVFEKSTKVQLDTLASHIKERIARVDKDFLITRKRYSDAIDENVPMKELYFDYSEILIDCDWTAGTKDNFFYFINSLKKAIPDKEITTTLRLWQYKDQKTSGIPPVAKVLLMCYNVQAANEYSTQNSIVSLDEVLKYIVGVDYPLRVDIALPTFSWGVIFRNQRFKGVIKNFEPDEALGWENYTQESENKVVLTKEIVIGDFFARPGDEIRIERLTKEELNELSKYILNTVKTDKYTRVSFFSWDYYSYNNYGTQVFKDIYNRNFY